VKVEGKNYGGHRRYTGTGSKKNPNQKIKMGKWVAGGNKEIMVEKLERGYRGEESLC